MDLSGDHARFTVRAMAVRRFTAQVPGKATKTTIVERDATAVMEYIESWYNRRRPHSYNAGLTPAAALATYQARCQPAAA
jgi:transposase InsO family protein